MPTIAIPIALAIGPIWLQFEEIKLKTDVAEDIIFWIAPEIIGI